MSPRSYLPSAQFMVIVGSLLIAGGTVAAAQYYISSRNAPAALASAGTQVQNQAWEESLADIQAQSGVNLPDAPDPNAVNTLISQSQSNNLTDSVGRGIFARLTTAGVQGLGDDAPTQDSIIAAASQQINASSKTVPPPTVTTIDPTPDSLHTFGNSVIVVFNRHTKANSNATLGIIAKATDTRTNAPLSGLVSIGEDYAALSRDLSSVPVPKTLAPLYQKAVANYAAIAALYADLGAVVDDPIRGIAALQQYQALLAETAGVFTNIAQSLKNGGILFTKDEPGSAWEIFLSAS